MSAYATLSSGPMTYRGLHWDSGCDLGIKTGPVGAELFEQFAQAFGGRIRRSIRCQAHRSPIPDEATPHLGEGSRMLDGRTKLPAALAIAVRVLLRRSERPEINSFF